MRISPIGNTQFVADIEDVDLKAISSGDFEYLRRLAAVWRIAFSQSVFRR